MLDKGYEINIKISATFSSTSQPPARPWTRWGPHNVHKTGRLSSARSHHMASEFIIEYTKKESLRQNLHMKQCRLILRHCSSISGRRKGAGKGGGGMCGRVGVCSCVFQLFTSPSWQESHPVRICHSTPAFLLLFIPGCQTLPSLPGYTSHTFPSFHSLRCGGRGQRGFIHSGT